MPDYIQNTPRNGLLGYLADALGSVDQYAQRPDNTMPMGKANPVLSILSNALVAPMQRTFDRVSYGEPVTNYGKANVPLIPQDTADTVANLLGLTAVAPKAVNALKPVAQTAYRNALVPSNVAHQGERGAIVWHGSPHKFDKFDASKIGTGEGAQAYGHGLYLAESPDVAKSYQASLGDIDMRVNGAAFNADDMTHQAALDVFGSGGDKWKAVKALQDQAQDLIARGKDWSIKAGKEKLARADWIASQKELPKYEEKSLGSLYKVDLPDEAIAKMLDWDAELASQPKYIRDALANAAHIYKDEYGFNAKLGNFMGSGDTKEQAIENLMSHNATGGAIYQGLKWHPGVGDAGNSLGVVGAGGKESASFLQRAGIPGIKYWDGGSRHTGTGTRNFVVFPQNEGLLQILERNGSAIK